MPRPRFYKLSEDRQRGIIRVARAEFAERGFEGASYNRIIERAGLSKGAMYYYFDDKIDLYATVLADVQRAMLEYVGPIDFTGDFWDAVEAFIRKTIEFSMEHPELAALFRGMRSVRAHDGPVAEVFERSRELTRVVLEAGQAAGAVRTDLPNSLLVSVAFAIGEATDYWLIEQFGEFAVDGDVEQTVSMMMRLWRDFAEPKEER